MAAGSTDRWLTTAWALMGFQAAYFFLAWVLVLVVGVLASGTTAGGVSPFSIALAVLLPVLVVLTAAATIMIDSRAWARPLGIAVEAVSVLVSLYLVIAGDAVVASLGLLGGAVALVVLVVLARRRIVAIPT